MGVPIVFTIIEDVFDNCKTRDAPSVWGGCPMKTRSNSLAHS